MTITDDANAITTRTMGGPNPLRRVRNDLYEYRVRFCLGSPTDVLHGVRVLYHYNSAGD